MHQNSLKPGSYFLTLFILHTAMFLGQVILAGISYYLVSAGKMPVGNEKLDSLFKIIIPIFGLSGVVASYLVFRNHIRNIRLMKSLPEKMNAYRTARIIRYALLEAPSLFSIAGFLLTGNLFFLGLAILIMIIFLLAKASRQSLIMDLELNRGEQEQLEKEDSVVG